MQWAMKTSFGTSDTCLQATWEAQDQTLALTIARSAREGASASPLGDPISPGHCTTYTHSLRLESSMRGLAPLSYHAP